MEKRLRLGSGHVTNDLTRASLGFRSAAFVTLFTTLHGFRIVPLAESREQANVENNKDLKTQYSLLSCSILFQVEKILVCIYGNSLLVINKLKTINFYLFLVCFLL